MNKPELQTQILNGTVSMLMLASAIGRLPESETRGELIYKHEKILQKLANLQADLDVIDKDTCYYGFIDKCPGKPCGSCIHWRNEGALLV